MWLLLFFYQNQEEIVYSASCEITFSFVQPFTILHIPSFHPPAGFTCNDPHLQRSSFGPVVRAAAREEREFHDVVRRRLLDKVKAYVVEEGLMVENELPSQRAMGQTLARISKESKHEPYGNIRAYAPQWYYFTILTWYVYQTILFMHFPSPFLVMHCTVKDGKLVLFGGEGGGDGSRSGEAEEEETGLLFRSTAPPFPPPPYLVHA